MAPNTSNFNADELEAPIWLNENFFQKVFRNVEKTQEIEIRNLKIDPASAKGDHYASIMFRATVDYTIKNNKNETKSLIIKTLPDSEGNKTELFGESKIFETESGMYTKIIPKFEEILKAAGDNTQLGAKCLYYELSPKKLIIFEDIVPLGYIVMRDRTPNLKEVKATYSKMAKWHAIAYKLNKEDPHFFDDYNNCAFVQPGLKDLESLHDGITNFIELLKSEKDLSQYLPYFEPYEGKLFGEVAKALIEAYENPDPYGLYTLCHGDFHNKNLMFKFDKDSKKFLDVKLLDFQMCYLGSIANDILYSTYMMLDANLRKNHLEELRYFYFTTFQETLRKIGFKEELPKMFDFKKELMRQKILDLFFMTTFLPVWYVFSEASMEVDDLLFDAQKRATAWKDPRYVNEIKELIPKFLHMGYLEN